MTAVVSVVMGAAACTGGGSSASSTSKSLSNQQFASPTSTPSLSASPSASASPGSALLQAAKAKGCLPADFVRYAGLAGGAVRRYVGEPAQKGSFVTGAPGRSGAVAQAGAALTFASVQLGRAKAALKGCPGTTNKLESVIEQDRTLLGLFAKELKAGKVADNRPTAVVAMHENVVAQASLMKMTVKDIVPTPAQVAG
jgi:hypothetical protein